MTSPFAPHDSRLDLAARALEAGQPAEAYLMALEVLHRVGSSAAAEAVSCWDRALSLAVASTAHPRRA
ncbi:MAG: hypothetical protein ACM31L_20090 [Actinomycetota bacterium]